MEILGRRSDRLDAFSRGPDKLDRGSDLDYNSDNRSEQPASNIEIDISSMESNSEVSNRSKTPEPHQPHTPDHLPTSRHAWSRDWNI